MIMKKALSFLLILIIALSVLPASEVFAAKDYEAFAKKLDRTTYDGQLGAIYTKNYTKFRVWAPTSDNVKVKFYKTGNSENYTKTVNMTFFKELGVWSATVKGNLKNTYYTYEFTRGNKSVETTDIYSRACGENSKRSMVVDLSSTNPKDWENDRHVLVNNQTDAKIWEVQVSDFSSSESSGVSKKNRGKFLAFTETDTTVNSVSGAASTCVDYLKQLGVNYVQINPFYDFGSIDESDKSGKDSNFNWGYDPVHYNVPEGSYSSDAKHGQVRIKECKQMIQALHKAGIGVIMDVVYNHTLKWKDSPFNLTVPDYYYRKNPDGSYSNGSGCGNDTASERAMFSKFMVDSVTYWAKEYHIDGFRFDLMGLHDVDTMNKIRESLDNIDTRLIMYGEAWNLSTTADSGTVLANQDNMSKLSSRIGAFDDTFRDAVKGSNTGVEKGFIQSGSGKANLKTGIMAQSNETTGWAKTPTQTVTYASCHDNLTLWDKLILSVKGKNGKYHERQSDLVAMNKLAGAITFTSQGIPFILAGEEFCRTKEGDENSYKSGVKLNQLDWTSLETFGDVSEYYKGLIEIRDNISAFRDFTSDTANSMDFISDVPAGVLAYYVKDAKYGKVCVIFNSSDSDATVSVDGSFVQLCDETTAGMHSLGTVSGKAKLAKKSACVLVDRESYEAVKPEVKTGKVIVRYHRGDDVFKSYTVTGTIGEEFNINVLHTVLMDYDVQKKTGQKGTFSDSIHYCDFYCEKYDGSFSSVTFRCFDDKTEKMIADATVMTNRKGQPYKTLSIPTIDGYTLNMEKLPKNGCGEFSGKDKTVTYYYTKKTSDDLTCRVNIVYMSSDGKILGTDTLSGDADSKYNTTAIEFDGYELAEAGENKSGVYSISEQNVLYIYNSVSLANLLINIAIVLAFVIVLGGLGFLYYRRRKAQLKSDIEIS